MHTLKKLAPGLALITLGAYLSIQGVQAMTHGPVYGGMAIWVLLFGGALLLVGVGVRQCLLAKS